MQLPQQVQPAPHSLFLPEQPDNGWQGVSSQHLWRSATKHYTLLYWQEAGKAW